MVQASLPDQPWLNLILPRLYYLPVVLAAMRWGWRGGVPAAVLCGVTLIPGLVGSRELRGPALVSFAVETGVLGAVGLITGVLADRARRQSERHQQLARQLSEVYEKLQENFEGMKRAERLSAIGQLSAGLAHEIRNPLASIAGAASILARSEGLDAKSARCLDIIQQESQRLNGLLTSFLDFARPRAPRFQTVKLQGVLDKVMELGAHAVGRKSVEIENVVSGALPDVDCDPGQLTQVLLNLVINAVEASPEGGRVQLLAEAVDSRVAVRVSDQGCGVADADIDRLFDPFFTTKENGTGLGLPVAHQIVSQMGGSLSARRNAERGMTFSVTLPIRQERHS